MITKLLKRLRHYTHADYDKVNNASNVVNSWVNQVISISDIDLEKFRSEYIVEKEYVDHGLMLVVDIKDANNQIIACGIFKPINNSTSFVLINDKIKI